MSPPSRFRFHLLFICLLVIGAGNSMLLAVAPPLVRELDLSDSSVGWIFSPSALIWVFASPYWGRLSDRIGRRPVAAIGLGAYALSMGVFGIAIMLGQAGFLIGGWLLLALIASRAIFGAAGSATSPAAQAYVADHTTRLERTQQLAALTSAFAMGQAFGPALCALLASIFGLVFPIWLIAALAAASCYALWRHLPESSARTPTQQQSGGDWRQSLALMRDKRIAAYLIYGFGLSTVAGVTVQVFGLFTMDRLGVSGKQAAEFTAAGFMVGALAVLATQMAILPRFRLTSRELMAWGSALTAAGVLIQIFAPSLGALLVSQAVQGVGGGLARPGFTGGASVAVRPDEQGAAAGLVAGVSGAGFVFSPLLGGVVYEYVGINAPLWITLALLVAMFVFALRSRRLKHAIVAEAPNDPAPH
jgi:MFS family permease